MEINRTLTNETSRTLQVGAVTFEYLIVPHSDYVEAGLLATTFAQIIVDPTSTVPNLGASGAIAAVMGAFLITYPRDQIRTVVLLGWFTRVTFVPAALMVGLWIVTQFFSEVGALMQMDTSGVADIAHIGGFAFGALMARLFENPGRTEERRLQQDSWNLP
jgi:membrane associated rhomboid family serine protease